MTERFFDKKGNLLRIPQLNPTSLESLINGENEVLQRPENMPQTEVPVFVGLLKGMLALDAEKRKSAAEMLDHEWLTSWLRDGTQQEDVPT
ncbi:MAG: hypothetical protein M1834_003345 [Cirrosporium novae-zelandiae]|nr:MAG: hypothetical protein M1834_003345 [Cirrosporium novae-zelandiae]